MLSAAMFVIAIVLHFTQTGRYSASAALICPLLLLALFYICRRIFLRKYAHEPKDTFFRSGPGLAPDMIFNLIYGVIAILVWIFVPLLIRALAKDGW
jgi:O-antigen/teichoic acid export membrane protein